MDKYSNTRPCITHMRGTGPVPALFHGWNHVAEVAAPSLLTGGHAGGQLCNTFALVEYEDGRVAQVPVNRIIFLDSGDSFASYNWDALGKQATERTKEWDERYGRKRKQER